MRCLLLTVGLLFYVESSRYLDRKIVFALHRLRNILRIATLLERVFNIDIETCSKCGGKMKIIAAIEDPKVIRKILEHMGLSTKQPPLYPARRPPEYECHFEDDFAEQHFEMNFDNFNESAD